MSTTPRGWPYPADTERPDVPLWIKALAEELEVRGIRRTHAMRQTVTLTNALRGDTTFQLPAPWPGKVLRVAVAAEQGGGNYAATVMNITEATGRVQVGVVHTQGIAASATVQVHLIVVEA